MYKDKDKAKEASKERMRRNRLLRKGVTDVTPCEENVTPDVTPESSTVKPTRHWNQDIDLPGDEGYRGCCFDENGIWHVGGIKKTRITADVSGNAVCNKNIPQCEILRRNEIERAKRVLTEPLAK